MSGIPDYSAYKEKSENVGGNLLNVLASLVDQQEEAQKEVERLRALLEEATANLKRLSEQEIPNLLDGIAGKLNLPDGRIVAISEKIRANISKENKMLAFKWLNDHNHGNLIKRRFIIEFNKEQAEWAKKFEQELENSKEPLNFKKEQNVHWQTLDSFVNEKLKEGEDIPLTVFGVYRQRSTKITSKG